MAVPRRGVHRLCGELVGLQRGGPARTWRSQRVGAVQSGGRGAVTGGGALIRLVLQDDTNMRTFMEALRTEDMDQITVQVVKPTEAM